jgi:cell division protein FtsB
MSPVAGFLLGAHLLVGGAVAGTVWRHERVRAAELAAVEVAAERDRADAERLRRDTQAVRALRDGMRARDPYAVELLARDRLGAVRPGEIPAPAQRGAAVDSDRGR